jgi:hypothetical protein
MILNDYRECIKFNIDNCHCRYFGGGGGGKSETVSNTSPAQEAAINRVLEYSQEAMAARSSAAQYSGQMVADTPSLLNEAYAQYSSGQYDAISEQAIQDLISGKPAYTFDEAAATKQWTDTYATPVMQAWNDSVAPTIKESYNAPGTLWSRSSQTGITNAANNFYGSSVTPTLFSALQTGQQNAFTSAENANSMRAGALNLPYAQFVQKAGAASTMQAQEQAELTAAYNEYIRTDPYRYAALVGSVGTASTKDTVAGTDYGPSLIGAGATLGAAFLLCDENVKENITVNTGSALDKIAKLRSYVYNYKMDKAKEQRSGLIAQEVKEVIPEGVIMKDGVLHIRVDSVIGLLVDAINELRREI